MPQDDAILVAQAKAGDQESFAALVERYQRKLYNLTLRMTGSAEDAADLTQEAFLNAWRGLPSFQGESSFSTWLYRLANNACIDFLRRKRRGEIGPVLALDDEQYDFASLIPDRSPSPFAALEQKELRAALARAVSQLSDEHRQVFILREFTGLSYAEIAQTLELGEGTVKSRLARARLALRSFLSADGNFSDKPSSEEGKEQKRTGGKGKR